MTPHKRPLSRVISDLLDLIDLVLFSCPWCGRKHCTSNHVQPAAEEMPIAPPNWTVHPPFLQSAINEGCEDFNDRFARRMARARQAIADEAEALRPWREYLERLDP